MNIKFFNLLVRKWNSKGETLLPHGMTSLWFNRTILSVFFFMFFVGFFGLVRGIYPIASGIIFCLGIGMIVYIVQAPSQMRLQYIKFLRDPENSEAEKIEKAEYLLEYFGDDLDQRTLEAIISNTPVNSLINNYALDRYGAMLALGK